MECHSVYQPHSRAGPIPKNSWPIKNRLHVLLYFGGGEWVCACVFYFVVRFLFYCLCLFEFLLFF